MSSDKPIIRSLHPVYQEGSNINVIVNSLMEQFRELEEQISNLKKEIQISTATGKYLDDIGKLFNLTRENGESDNEFRARIKAFWPGFSGSGTLSDLKATISRMTGISEDSIDLVELGPLKILIKSNIGPDFGLIQSIRDVVWKAKAAGIYPFFEISSILYDSVSITSEHITINIINKLFWDYSEWGAGTW